MRCKLQLDESRLTWPEDLVFLVTDRIDIAEKIYLSAIGQGKPSLMLMIRPRLRSLLHVKHFDKSRNVAKYSGLFNKWLWLLNHATLQRPPKWKNSRTKVAQDMKTMALQHFTPVRFTVGNLTMTWLGPDGLMTIEGDGDWQRNLKLLGGSYKNVCLGRSRRLWFTWRATVSNTGLVVDYRLPRSDRVIVYGGRFVMCPPQ